MPFGMMNQPEDEMMEQGNEEQSVESVEDRLSKLEARVQALEAKKPSTTAAGIVASKAKGFYGS